MDLERPVPNKAGKLYFECPACGVVAHKLRKLKHMMRCANECKIRGIKQQVNVVGIRKPK